MFETVKRARSAADCSPLRYGLIASQVAVADPADPQCERCGHCYSVCPRGAIGVVEEPAFPSLFAGADVDREISPGAILLQLACRLVVPGQWDRVAAVICLLVAVYVAVSIVENIYAALEAPGGACDAS